MTSFKDKVVVITGGNSGIGYASAARFAEQGAKVYITGRRREAVEEAAEKLGPNVTGLVSDASSLEQTRALFETLSQQEERIDVLFLNAGIAPLMPLEQTTPEVFDNLIDTNLKGPYFSLQYALGLLDEGSSVIFNTSIVGQKGMQGSSAYAATKAALRVVVRVAAAELGPRKIRVNAVSPGVTRTPIMDKIGMNEEAIAQMAAAIPLGRVGQPDEIADAVLFLAGATFVTGVELDVDGGMAQV